MRLREAEVEKKRAMEEERLRKEEKKKTDMQVEAEAGRRLQQEASKTLIDSNSNQSRRIWQQQEDFESDVGSHASMDSGEKGEWGGRSGTGSSWLTRQVSVWCIISASIILAPSCDLYTSIDCPLGVLVQGNWSDWEGWIRDRGKGSQQGGQEALCYQKDTSGCHRL